MNGSRTIRFGDVVHNVDENIRDPLSSGLERYVGLEHIDPDSLHVKRWGLIAEGTSFTRRFKPGQVLFGKRRAYQRKVAVAEFEGLCSSDILIFEPKDDRLLPELLPFFCQTERFYQHALNTSAGSLSPRTKFKDLARYEFPLPPLEEQRRIAEILWALEKARIENEFVYEKTHALRQAVVNNISMLHADKVERTLTTLVGLSKSSEIHRLKDLLVNCQYGLSIPLQEKGKFPILRMMNIVDWSIVANDMKFVNLSNDEFQSYRVDRGDILFNRTNSSDLVGKLGIFDLEGDFVFASYLLRLKAKTSIVIPEFLNYYLNSVDGQKQILSLATPGVSQSNINASNLQSIHVPIPPLKEQEKVVARVKCIEAVEFNLLRQISNHRQLKVRLLGELLNNEQTI